MDDKPKRVDKPKRIDKPKSVDAEVKNVDDKLEEVNDKLEMNSKNRRVNISILHQTSYIKPRISNLLHHPFSKPLTASSSIPPTLLSTFHLLEYRAAKLCYHHNPQPSWQLQ
jgi:hypothetical protein